MRYPAVLIGREAIDFKRKSRAPIKIIRNLEETRELVAYYSNLDSLDYDLIIEDLSFIPPAGVFLLLKLVEEAKFNIVLLSTYDVFDGVLLSKIAEFRKRPIDASISEFMPVDKGRARYEEMLSPDTHVIDRMRFMLKISPVLIYYEPMVGKKRARDKLYSLIEG